MTLQTTASHVTTSHYKKCHSRKNKAVPETTHTGTALLQCATGDIEDSSLLAAAADVAGMHRTRFVTAKYFGNNRRLSFQNPTMSLSFGTVRFTIVRHYVLSYDSIARITGLQWFFLIAVGPRPRPATPLHTMPFCPVQFSRTQPLVVRSSF